MVTRHLQPKFIQPRDFADHGPCVEDLAMAFALQDPKTSETLIDTLVTQAIQRWRIDDATFWQRVKFYARLIRATRKVDSDAEVGWTKRGG